VSIKLLLSCETKSMTGGVGSDVICGVYTTTDYSVSW